MVPICLERWCTEANEATQTHCYNPVTPAYPIRAYCAHGQQRRCQEDFVSLPSGRLEKTTRLSPHHLAQHRPTGSETTPPYAPRSSSFGSEPPSVEDYVDVWRYAIVCCMPEMTTTFSMEKLEWLGYLPMKKNCSYIYSFWQNVRMWRTRTHTQTAWQHRSCLCIASRGKNRPSLAGAHKLCHRWLKRLQTKITALAMITQLTRMRVVWISIHSWFLPHDAMQTRPVPSCSVRLSVCVSVRLSVTFVGGLELWYWTSYGVIMRSWRIGTWLSWIE